MLWGERSELYSSFGAKLFSEKLSPKCKWGGKIPKQVWAWLLIRKCYISKNISKMHNAWLGLCLSSHDRQSSCFVRNLNLTQLLKSWLLSRIYFVARTGQIIRDAGSAMPWCHYLFKGNQWPYLGDVVQDWGLSGKPEYPDMCEIGLFHQSMLVKTGLSQASWQIFWIRLGSWSRLVCSSHRCSDFRKFGEFFILCHVPHIISEECLQCSRPHYPAERDHCHYGILLPWTCILGLQQCLCR